MSVQPEQKFARGTVRDLGRMGYGHAVEIQRETLDEVAAGGAESLLYVEHDPVLTLGSNFHDGNLLLSSEQYAKMGIEVVRTDRGGDVTYHGPGQLVAYPIFDLNRHGRDLHKWLRDLEEAVIVALAHFGLEGVRFPPHTGVWIKDRKICAMGVKVKRWVSMHGIALNCSNDLGAFELIVPCGIQGYGVTSLSRELGRDVTPPEVQPVLTAAFERIFGLDFSSA